MTARLLRARSHKGNVAGLPKTADSRDILGRSRSTQQPRATAQGSSGSSAPGERGSTTQTAENRSARSLGVGDVPVLLNPEHRLDGHRGTRRAGPGLAPRHPSLSEPAQGGKPNAADDERVAQMSKTSRRSPRKCPRDARNEGLFGLSRMVLRHVGPKYETSYREESRREWGTIPPRLRRRPKGPFPVSQGLWYHRWCL
jgi:hypothetical protein